MTEAAERGTTVVSDRAVRRIAGRAAGEAVPAPGGSGTGSATVRGRRADVAVKVAVPFPAPLPEATRTIQDHVTRRTGELTGLHIRAARIQVTGLLPVAAARTAPVSTTGADTGATDRDAGRRTPLRWWSPRRLPTALLALTAATACGALVVDLVRVHLAHRPAASWRADTVHWLERHGPDAPFATIAAGALAALGILMIALAVTPGRRGLLSVDSPAAQLRAAMDRKALALVVRDAAGDVPGIGAVRVRVHRRRVAVRAQLAFGERAVARRGVETTAREVLDGCCLRRSPRVRVKVRADSAWTAEADQGEGDGDDGQRPLDGTPPTEESPQQKGRATDAP
ncbi:DUF6286 domain-containing Asp23/Gls24 family envelope stress response protein [Streptomyces sp. NPDC051684]|uniref:DUF6286 domain-containing Asp23/Gls24 family envelope stress response protein n=1 Tax=Streptomyces sp. NPDC051684 TaxID=3365670 RepID=UPI0037B2320E